MSLRDGSTDASIDEVAVRFLEGFNTPDTRYWTRWRPRYEQTIQAIRIALQARKPDQVCDIIWKTLDNSVSNAGQGVVAFEVVDRLRDRFTQATQDIADDPDPLNFDRIVGRFESWKRE